MKETYKFDKQEAQKQVQWAVKSGTLQKPNTCQECGDKYDKRFIQGHHEDYSKPLEVEWLCRFCHNKRHKKHTDLKKVNESTLYLRLPDSFFLEYFRDCIYEYQCKWDDMRQLNQHLLKVKNDRGIVVYSAKFYLPKDLI